MIEKEVFINAYGKVQVPKPMNTRGCDDKEYVLQRDSFFTRIQASLDLSQLVLKEVILVKPEVFVAEGEEDEPKRIILSEDLQFKDRQVLATAVHQIGPRAERTARFAKYPLSDDTINVIQEFRTIEEILF